MKVNYTIVLARKILLAFLALVLVLSITAIFVRNSITKKLENIAKLAENIKQDQFKPQQSLLLLHQAEDLFQQSLVYPDSVKSSDYKDKITAAFNKIDTLLQSSEKSANLSKDQSRLLKSLYSKKLKLSNRLRTIKYSFDSLLTIYSAFNKEVKQQPAKNATSSLVKKIVDVKADTVKKVQQAEKKRFFSRLKDAIANKTKAQQDVIVINNNKNTADYVLNSQKRIAADRNSYVKQLQNLEQRNTRLQNMQKQLTTLNLRISNELGLIVNEIKDINYKTSDELRTMSFQNYQETTASLNKFYLVALFLVILFAILLIVVVIQLNRAEMLLRGENERAVKMAQQKMDLLLHMSHEIRNPLTSIKGFLYIFSKTILNDRQKEMLDSIRSSSDMLLLTLNDTLDAAKMENSELKINEDPFKPDFIITEVIESMSYSAARKSLEIGYTFSGDKQTILVGDYFRLKQVLINLLSNAIKYTKEGSITLTAELLGGDNGLKVELTDTGVGISQDQQTHLFSKYYQTSSSKGQIGTGLGLFICKQLIERQGGTISVKSIPDKGTTFSFVIPYKLAAQPDTGKLVIENAVALLSGVEVLAVDDNEINLLFLKAMTSKWHMVLHQTTTVEEAIDLAAKQVFAVVLTDIQLPGMSGFQLLEAIKGLEAPYNSVPVIAISGEDNNTAGKGFEEKGFSGFVSKPFMERELFNQLVKALYNKG